MPDATTMEKPLLDPVALAHEIAKEAVRQTAYAPRWVSLKQASAMLGGVDQKTLRKWASGYHGKLMVSVASIEEFDANAGTRRH